MLVLVALLVKMNPAVLPEKVQAGDPKLQAVALVAVGALAVAPNRTLPAAATCTFLVTVLEPAAIVKLLPLAPPVVLSQFTLGVPVADSVPLTPPV